jgi:hypothetical protein
VAVCGTELERAENQEIEGALEEFEPIFHRRSRRSLRSVT